MQTPRRICSIHHVVELAPGVWTLHRVARHARSSTDQFTEAACPTCLQGTRETFEQQCPASSLDTTPHA